MNKTLILGILIVLSGGDNTNSDTVNLIHQQNKELRTFIQKEKSKQVFVQGGTFWMGDFCSTIRDGGSFCTSDKNNKPVHEVELSSYLISKFKITHENYSFYLALNGLPAQEFGDKNVDKMLTDMTFLKSSPAIIT